MAKNLIKSQVKCWSLFICRNMVPNFYYPVDFLFLKESFLLLRLPLVQVCKLYILCINGVDK